MIRAWLVMLMALVAGCEGNQGHWNDPFTDVCSTSAWMGNGGLRVEKFPCEKSVDWTGFNGKHELHTLTDYEFAPDQRQELIGRTIVMVARGWETWPERITWYGSTPSVTFTMGTMKPNSRYRVTVQEIGD